MKLPPPRSRPAQHTERLSFLPVMITVLALLVGPAAGLVAGQSGPPARPTEGTLAGDVLSSNQAWTQEAKLQAADPHREDWAGYAVDIDGGTAVVGAPSYPLLDRAGRAFIYDHGPNGWTHTATLIGDQTGDLFGYAVAIQGDTLAIGAPWGDTPDAAFAGGVHLYQRVGTTWSKTDVIAGQDSTLTDEFGATLSLDGDLLIVGARSEDPGGVTDAGAAYVFKPGTEGWHQAAKLVADDPSYGAWFGHALDADDGTIIIGAHRYGEQQKYGGTAYVFEPDANETAWTQTTQLWPPEPSRFHTFGFAVATEDGTALIGEPGRWGLDEPGTVHVYERTESGAWKPAAQLHGDRDPETSFGWAIDLQGTRAIIGAPTADDLDIPGPYPGGLSPDPLHGSGAAFIYENGADGAWHRFAKLVPNDSGMVGPVASEDGLSSWTYDRFGFAVAQSSDRALVGAYGHDTNASARAGAGYTYTPGCEGQPLPSQVSPPLGPCLSAGGDLP